MADESKPGRDGLISGGGAREVVGEGYPGMDSAEKGRGLMG